MERLGNVLCGSLWLCPCCGKGNCVEILRYCCYMCKLTLDKRCRLSHVCATLGNDKNVLGIYKHLTKVRYVLESLTTVLLSPVQHCGW